MAGGLYSPAAGDVLTAANAIDYWSKQSVIICTSGTRPATPRSGMTIWQTDTVTFAVYGTAWCETTPYSATVATDQTTTSTSYADLATTGPAVTVTTGTKALVTLSSASYNSAIGANQFHAVAVSGATTLAAADANAIRDTAKVINYYAACARTFLVSSLTGGINVFTSKYKTSGTTAGFVSRDVTILGIPT